MKEQIAYIKGMIKIAVGEYECELITKELDKLADMIFFKDDVVISHSGEFEPDITGLKDMLNDDYICKTKKQIILDREGITTGELWVAKNIEKNAYLQKEGPLSTRIETAIAFGMPDVSLASISGVKMVQLDDDLNEIDEPEEARDAVLDAAFGEIPDQEEKTIEVFEVMHREKERFICNDDLLNPVLNVGQVYYFTHEEISNLDYIAWDKKPVYLKPDHPRYKETLARIETKKTEAGEYKPSDPSETADRLVKEHRLNAKQNLRKLFSKDEEPEEERDAVLVYLAYSLIENKYLSNNDIINPEFTSSKEDACFFLHSELNSIKGYYQIQHFTVNPDNPRYKEVLAELKKTEPAKAMNEQG
jgi:hypothetical protein